MTVNMWSWIWDKIIHVHVQLPVDTISTSTTNTYIHTNRWGPTITSIQSARRYLCCLPCYMRGNYQKGASSEIYYYPVAWEYKIQKKRSTTAWAMYMVIFPIKRFLVFRVCGLQSGADPWIYIKISGSTLWPRGDYFLTYYGPIQ